MKKILDWKEYTSAAVRTAAEGIVMLKNDNSALPLREGETVSVFGRIQLHYYRSGTGSGGMVNVDKVVGITDGLIEAGVRINTELLDIYRKWDADNPFDLGTGWGGEPWSQKEMPLDDTVVAAAAKYGDAAIAVIGRTAGEEQDQRLEEGSYLLSSDEMNMLALLRKHFSRVIVILNVGGLVDMSFIDDYSPDCVLLAWQGGMTGGTGAADVLTGRISPSGKLPDTVAYHVTDYPSDRFFGDKKRNFYSEDIYVGYRWFETFAPEKVRYPFGYGLSYTTFSIETDAEDKDGNIVFTAIVKNTGACSGKEVVQIYVEKPQGKLGQPVRELCGFEKTRLLAPGEEQTLTITVDMSEIASYDDSGATGHPHCWVLESGTYNFFAGTDVRSAGLAFSCEADETLVVSKCVQAMAPVMPFERIRPLKLNGRFVPLTEGAPLNEVDEAARRLEKLPEALEITGDRGIKLADVCTGKNSLDEFIAQLSEIELSSLIRGEGMGSPRVTAGTASAFGGVTDRLEYYGIPAACCSDGPSGMRLDCGAKAFSLPNGSMIASTFDRGLITELFCFVGLEMAANRVDCLLGPGMNIHRHPLNGRNFEYFSEDPFLSGMIAAAELKGMHSAGVTGTLKHFCGNNQETNRHYIDSVISERALREIYLKGFEIAVKKAGASSIMTTYGAVNGLWTAGSFDLNSTILRDEWGFEGFTMTDWWANVSVRGGEPSRNLLAPMAAARNDVYMVCADCSAPDDGIDSAIADGSLTVGELQRNAADILGFLIKTNAMKRKLETADVIEIINRPGGNDDVGREVTFYDLDDELELDLSGVSSVRGSDHCFALKTDSPGWFNVTLTASSTQSEVAQIPVTIFFMGTACGTFTWNGTGGKPVSFTNEVPIFSRFTSVRLYFAQNGLDLISIKFKRTKSVDSYDLAFAAEEK